MTTAGQIAEVEGSTATSLLLLNDELYLAYIGDSEAILIKGETDDFINLCPEIDLAGENLQEAERVKEAGGIILKVGRTERVQGELELTRSFGAARYQPYILAQPHLGYFNIEGGSFLVVASDGLWKTMRKAEVAKLVNEYRDMPENEIAGKLYNEAVGRNSMDNMTIVVINLEKRRKLKKDGAFGPPPVPTSKYTKENKKTFFFPMN